MAIERDTPEFSSRNTVDSVEFRQPLVDESEFSVEKIKHASVFFYDCVEKHLSFGAHQVAHFGVELWEFGLIALKGVEIAGLQPLAAKILGKSAGLGIGHHPLHLGVKDGRVLQPSLFGEAEKFVVG